MRKKETLDASKVLGISCRENIGIEDGNIELNLINKIKIVSTIRKYKPNLVFAPFPFDRHPDHVNTGNLLKEAIFFSGLQKFEASKFEAFKPKKIFYYPTSYEIPVSFIFDISAAFEKKIEVLKCYGSQFYHPESKEPQTFISSKLFQHEIESRARYYGFKLGVEFGEAYFSYESIKVNAETLFKI